jgi:hypothetical protein
MSGWFVTSNDIKAWTETDKRRAEEILPLLVKKLILASSKPKEISFSSGDAVTTGGWDGILEVEEGNEFIPTGKSGWEFGTNSGVKGKGDEDYQKRTQSPEPLVPHESTFIFVTSRPWAKRDAWVTAKKATGEWKDVKGINAGTLESWLETCPAVHRWFANLIGKRPGELWDLEQAWSALSNVTSLPLTTELFLKSREEKTQQLTIGLAGKGSVLRVKSLSEREAYGFILASLKSNDELSARALIVKNQATWDQLMDSKNTLVLIPLEFKPSNMGAAVRSGYNVVLALDNRDSASSDIQLERISKQTRIAAIQSVGLSKEQAEKVYSDTKGYLEPVLRHSLLKPIDRPRPAWTDSVNTDVLFAALFATEWDINNAEDKNIMATLSAMEYQEFEKQVFELTNVPDSPLRLIGNIWQVISKMDMWLLIAPHLKKTHLERLASVFKPVLSDLDPTFELPPDERYMAGIKGIKPVYSRHIKSGLANSLALLSTHGDNYAAQCGTTRPSNLARYCVAQIFENSVDAKKWYSLGQCLQSLAEAAPQEFLDALERSAQGAEPPIANLFAAEGSGIFGGCPHANLLWSIELLSWNKEYLAGVALCLARLSEIDPGGKWSNRPFSSLVDIFLGWLNNTKATHKERLEVIEKVLLPNHPDVSWRLMVSLLMGNSHFTSGVQKPEYREWADDVEKTVLNKDFYEYIEAIVELLLREVDRNPGARLPDLITNFNSYTDVQQKVIVERLLGISPETLKDEDREEIVTALRRQISHHREFPGADWAWPKELLDKLEVVYHKFEFEDAVKKSVYLFNATPPDLIQPVEHGKNNWREEKKLVHAERLRAIEEIIKTKGFNGLKELALECNNPELVGLAVSQSSFSEEAVTYVQDWLGRERNLELAAQCYVSVRSMKDWDWVISLLDKNKDWDETKKAALLLSLPACSQTFDLVEGQELPVQSKYWLNINQYFLQDRDKNRVSFVASKLLEHNRPLAAIDAMGQVMWDKDEPKDLDCKLIATILMRIITDPSDISRVSVQNVRHDIIKAIEYIQDQAELPIERMSQIEFSYLTVFHEEFRPRYLNEMVANDPSFFVQLVKWGFKRRDGVTENGEAGSEEIRKQRAEATYNLLRTISISPENTGNTIDSEKLNKWVDQSRDLLSQVGRQVVGDVQIGEYLARCPDGTDGVWPHEAVRNVIERVRSTDLERGVAISRFNSRGATWRSHDEGGGKERELESLYRNNAQKLELTYPRTAGILRDIANDYAGFAQMEDRAVDLED